MYKPDQIVRALRCTSTYPAPEDPTECEGCPYKLIEKAELKPGKTVTVYSCDCDQVALDAADMIEKMTNEAENG